LKDYIIEENIGVPSRLRCSPIWAKASAGDDEAIKPHNGKKFKEKEARYVIRQSRFRLRAPLGVIIHH
jgi:hypothetical protein